VSSISFGSITTSTSSTSGMIATVAVDVCTRPWLSVAGTRWTLCTPASYFSLLYTRSPEISKQKKMYWVHPHFFVSHSMYTYICVWGLWKRLCNQSNCTWVLLPFCFLTSMYICMYSGAYGNECKITHL
jgi:hypothetical protein